jgi:hypothetical protein
VLVGAVVVKGKMNRVLAVFFLVGSALSQDKVPPHDCDKVSSSPACKSFNKLLEKGDRDLVNATSGPNQAVVCFRPDEDTFVLVSYGRVEDRSFLAGPGPNLERSSAMVTAMVYKNQRSDDLRGWAGYWQKQTNAPKTRRCLPLPMGKREKSESMRPDCWFPTTSATPIRQQQLTHSRCAGQRWVLLRLLSRPPLRARHAGDP